MRQRHAICVICTICISYLAGCTDPNTYPNWIASSEPQFTITNLAPIYNINDAGVGDLDNDGRLDLWTTNHSSYQWISLDGYHGLAKDGVEMLGLFHDMSAPGMAYGAPEKPTENPVRVFANKSAIVIRLQADADYASIQGEVYIPWQTTISTNHNASVDQDGCKDISPCLNGRFFISRGSELILEPAPPPSDGFPISLTFDNNLALADIDLGRMGRQPSTHAVTFRLRDRHAFALADAYGNDQPELFISRGGARGRLPTVDPSALDEMFVWQENRYADQIAATGIQKSGCPGRQAAWVDIDRDGDLDLYQVCGRAGSANSEFGNRLYLQTSEGNFTESANQFGLALPGSGTFVFIPDPSNHPAMIWATANTIELHKFDQTKGTFALAWQHKSPGSFDDKLSIGDLTRDGQQEVLRISEQGNLLVSNLFTNPSASNLSTIGGPAASIEGDMVDVNGDGWLDIHLVPQGLYTQVAGRLTTVGLLATSSRRTPNDARENWFDVDHDGDLDLWLVGEDAFVAPRRVMIPRRYLPAMLTHAFESTAQRFYGKLDWFTRQWHSALAINNTTNRTLSVRVVGSSANPQSIGATVRLFLNDIGTQSVILGSTDGSRYSQTHYQAYFGLGDEFTSGRIEVTFPDDQVTITPFSGAKNLTIHYPTSK